MNQEVLLGYLHDPSLLKLAPLGELEQLVNVYPYCQTVQLLYLKALYEQRNGLYQAQLNRAAAYLPDRSIMYYLIHTGSVSAVTADYGAYLKNSRLIPGATRTDVPLQLPEMPLQQGGLEGLTERLKKLATITLPDISSIISRIGRVRNDHETRVKNIIGEYLLQRSQPAEVRKKETHLQELSESEDQVKSIPEEVQPVVEEVTDNVPDVPPGKEAALSKEELVERFIEANPAMPRPRKDFFNPVNMAHYSTIDNDDIVSETLAEVHLKQGRVRKALKIYQRLCLIIPEKSIYFATRIEKIKKENNLL
jgi:tetratricopeptide (TPR) repeat protein